MSESRISAMTATDRALALPEIQILIFRALNEISRPTLVNCACVCRSWSDIAVSIIWRGSPIIDGQRCTGPHSDILLRLAHTPQRLRHYIQHAKFLVLDRGFASRAEQFEVLWNPVIWSAARHQYLYVGLRNQIMSDAHMQMLLQSQLSAIELIDGVYSDRFLESLLTRCPSLQWLRLVGLSRITSHGLVRLLRTMQSLRGLHLLFNLDQSIVDDAVLSEIMELRHLKDLLLDRANVFTNHLVHQSQHKLQCLQNLHILCIDGPGLRTLLPHLLQLKSLILLGVETSPDFNVERDILMPVSELPRLVVFELRTDRALDFTLHGLAAVGTGCPNLRRVELSGTSYSRDLRLECLPVLSVFASKLKHLEYLKYTAPCILNEFEFQSLADSCPFLDTLVLRGDLRLRLFESMTQNVKFTRLRTISFDSYSWQGIQQITDSTPELNQLHIIDIIKTKLREKIPSLQRLVPYGFIFEEETGDKLSTQFLGIMNAALKSAEEDKRRSLHPFHCRWLLETFEE